MAAVLAPDEAGATLEAHLDAAQATDGEASPDEHSAQKRLEAPCSALSKGGQRAPTGVTSGRLDDVRVTDRRACHTPCAAGAFAEAETMISQKTAGRLGERQAAEDARDDLAEAPLPAVAEEEVAPWVSDGGSDAGADADHASAWCDEGAAQADVDDAPDGEEVGETEETGEAEPVEAGDALQDGEVEDEADEAPHEDGMAVEGAPLTLVCKPKRALSPWALWLAATHGGKISKSAGEEWRALSEEARAPFVEQAAQDKARHAAQAAEYAAAIARGEADVGPGGGAAGRACACAVEVDDSESALPIARVRRVMKAAKTDSKAISKEGAFLVSKAAEMVLGMLAEQAAELVLREKRRALSLHDLGRVIYGTRSADLFAFLHDDLTRKMTLERVPARAGAQPRALAKPRDPAQPRMTVERRPRPAAGEAEEGGEGEAGAGDAPDAEGESEAGVVARAGRAASAGARKPAARVRPRKKETVSGGKKEAVGGGVAKRRKADAPVQATTMTSFFTKQPGAWQPRADDYVAPAGDPAPRPGTKRRRRAKPGAGEAAEQPAEQDHDGLAKRLAEEEAEHDAAEAAAAAAAGPSKKRRVVQSDDEEGKSGDEVEAPSRVPRGARAGKARGKVALRRRAVVESDDEGEGKEAGGGSESEGEEAEGGEEVDGEEGEEEEEGEGEEADEEEEKGGEEEEEGSGAEEDGGGEEEEDAVVGDEEGSDDDEQDSEQGGCAEDEEGQGEVGAAEAMDDE
jgi:histone H3/H4